MLPEMSPDEGQDVFCPYCDYCLRGTDSNVCPECGGVVDRAVRVKRSPADVLRKYLIILALCTMAIAVVLGAVIISALSPASTVWKEMMVMYYIFGPMIATTMEPVLLLPWAIITILLGMGVHDIRRWRYSAAGIIAAGLYWVVISVLAATGKV